MMKSNEEHVHAARGERGESEKKKNDKLNHVWFDKPLSVTDLHLCCLTGVIDTTEHSSIFKHTARTKSHFILGLAVSRLPGVSTLRASCFPWQTPLLLAVWTTIFIFMILKIL